MSKTNGNYSSASDNHKKALANNRLNSLLQAAADCVSALLADEDFERGVNRALAILGTNAGADRLGVGEHFRDPIDETLSYVVVQYEWLSSNATSQLHHSELNRIDCKEFEEDRYKFVSGHCGGSIETYPEPFQSGQKKLGVKAVYAIPIMVEGQYWGLIGLDFCQTARELCDAEIAVLKTAATCIGSAIQRERNRQAKEKAERSALLEQQKAIELAKRVREAYPSGNRILNITANAAQALLNNENLERAIFQALQIVGEGIDTDRVAVMEHRDDSTGETLGYTKMLFEWHSASAVSQLHHPDLQQVSYEGVESWYEQLSKGEAVGGIVSELPEPIRSGQMEIGVKSTYSVPITIDGKYWGLIGFDNCREAKQRSETEISILKITATCIGSAIQQSRIRIEREQAERQILLEQQKAAQLAEHNRILEQRDRILAATAEASNILLTEEDFNIAVNRALQIIGEALDTDRVTVIENWHNPYLPLIPHWRVLYEWNSPYAIPQISHPELTKGSYEGIEEWYELQVKGQTISCRLEEMPEPFRSGQAKIGVKILHAVPIIIKGKHWGIIGFDDCREETRRSEAELSMLKTTAACIGGAIHQERIRRAKEEAERNILLEREQAAQEKATQLAESNHVLSLRDRWLEATANAANQLLEIADLDEGINAALKMLGEGLDCDRVAVMQNFEDDTGEFLGFMHLLYEWDSPYVSSQILHPKLNQISTAGLEDWVVKLKAGDWIGGILSELNQPFRDAMAELDVKSTYAVPVFVNNIYWGALGIDYCREPKRLTSAEIAVFKTAASCIGSAIYRQQIQQEKERTELAILDERNRMAREIHDTLAQAFTGISLQLEAAKNILSTQPKAAQERLLRAKNLATDGLTEARRSVRALRPEALEYSDLATALRQLVDKMVSGTNIKTQVLIEGEPQSLTPQIEVDLFRIAGQAITNTLQHAQASEICVQLIYETHAVHLTIEDNGIGFAPQLLLGEGFGLIGMQERSDRLNGNLTINSAIGQGTEIIVTVTTNE